jgi:Tol biopolymer transport system component/DNA-binding winged helix-turn-helix (wHTH) protein
MISMQTPKRVIRFAAFEVDLESGELRKHGLRIKLQDQPFKILVALLEKPGEVISREELRKRIWGNDTFVDFNHGLNAAVNRLRDALGDSAESPRYVETLARRGYRFVAPLNSAQEQATATAVTAGTRRRLRWAVAVSLASAGLLSVGYWLARGRVAATPPRLVQVTAHTGSETMPTFSPDGKQVAFVWNGEKEVDANIYAKVVGTETALQLTHDPGADLLPSWSPDGRQIAFVRVHGKTGIYLVSPFGGPERKLLELPGVDLRPSGPETKIVGDLLYPIVNRPSWSADGRYLAVVRNSEPPEFGDGAVLLIPSEGGAPRRMLVPRPGTWYKHPTFSPEGRRMAVALIKAHAGRAQTCELQILGLSPKLDQEGEPRTVLSDCQQLRGIAWTPDGASLVVSGFRLPHHYAWRVSAAKEADPERIEMAGADALWPAVSAVGGRLAFARSVLQADLWRLVKGERPSPFLSSTARDTSPRFSADGKHIAFQSGRGGTNDIWVATADGRGLVQITKNLGRSTGSPVWSPGGQWIAFDSAAQGGGTDVWIVEASGGPPRKLTSGPGSNAVPSWSRDGKSVYFVSSRSGRNEIWRMPVDGGAAEQVTRNGGFAGQESSDGKTLIYTKSDSGSEGLYSVSLAGGKEKQLLADQVVRRSFDVVPRGVYYMAPRDESLCEIRFHELATGHSQMVGEIERPVAFGLSVSPDQKTFLFSRPVTGADLMLIESFR